MVRHRWKEIWASPGTPRQYAAALAALAVATALRWALTPLIQQDYPFITYFPLVVFTAWYAGLRPALLTVLTGAGLAVLLFVSHAGGVAFTRFGDVLAVGIFIFIGSSIAAFVELQRVTENRAVASALQAREREQEARQEVKRREQAEAALEENEERLRYALESARLGYWDWNVRTGAVKWSDSLEPLHGLAPGKFDGTFDGFLALIHPEDRQRVQETLASGLEPGRDYEMEIRVVWPDGSVHWVAAMGKAQFDDSGQPVRMVGVSRDIDDRKQSETVRRELAAIVESSYDAIIGKDLQGFITTWNLGAGKLYGYAPEEVIGRSISLLVPPEIQNDVGPILGRLTRGERIQQYETLRMTKDGRRLEVSLTISPILDDSGAVAGASTIARDITERKRFEAEIQARNEQIQTQAEELEAQYEELQLQHEELAEQDRHRNEFLAMLAHELRNPLAPIVAAVEVLRLRTAGDPALYRQEEIISRQARHLARLVDDLLDVSRITQGKVRLQKEPVDLNVVVEQALQICNALLQERRQELTVSLPAESLPLEADATRLVQILCNLLNNAAKYTEPGGRVFLTAEREGSEAVLRVRDSGRGIPKEVLPHVFDLFVQEDRGSDRSLGGLGVGLTLVRSLVEQHGGSVEAHSEGLDQGSEFVVRLPLLRAPRDEARLKKDSSPVRTLPGAPRCPATILLVDDNRDAADTLAELMQLWGHEVRVARSGQEALAAAGEQQPEAVLLDIGMPGMDGYEVARRMRGQPPVPFLVALTGYGSDEDRQRAREAGFHHHLTKPVDPDALRELLNQVPER